MNEYSQNETTSVEQLRERIVTLEGYVEEIGNVLYDVIERLHGIPYPDCPPICARKDKQESS